jgi:hypothetical protein
LREHDVALDEVDVAELRIPFSWFEPMWPEIVRFAGRWRDPVRPGHRDREGVLAVGGDREGVLAVGGDADVVGPGGRDLATRLWWAIEGSKGSLLTGLPSYDRNTGMGWGLPTVATLA